MCGNKEKEVTRYWIIPGKQLKSDWYNAPSKNTFNNHDIVKP